MSLIEISHPATRKAVATLRARLTGAAMENREWARAVEALEYAIFRHNGVFRKDNVTPYILHPVQVANHVMTLPNLRRRVLCVRAALTHDVLEDCPEVSYQSLADDLGEDLAFEVELLTKKTKSVVKTTESVMTGLAGSDVGSIVKPVDRAHNQSTMPEAFTLDKAFSTVEFTEQYILPMMKIARRKFVDQELAYENLKVVLKTQVAMIQAFHQGWGRTETGVAVPA